MRALAKLKKEKGLWWQDDAPMPHVGHNDVLVKITKTAICGTDLHIYQWDDWAKKTIPVPMITGHEFVGVIERVGEDVQGFKAGDRVSGEGHITCGHCRNCQTGLRHLCRNTVGIGVNRQGCFADYLSIPKGNVYIIPDKISDDVAAMLDPLGNAVHTALSFDLIGEDILITGAGPIGIMAVAIAKHVGARYVVITDVNPYRLDLAKQMGADYAVDVSKTSLDKVMSELKMKEGFDVGLEMSGVASAFDDMLSHMNNGGRIALLGIPSKAIAIDWNQVIFKGLTMKGIYGREIFNTWYKMIMMLQSGLNVDTVITHRFKAENFQQGFDAMLAGQCGKVILEWD